MENSQIQGSEPNYHKGVVYYFNFGDPKERAAREGRKREQEDRERSRRAERQAKKENEKNKTTRSRKGKFERP